MTATAPRATVAHYSPLVRRRVRRSLGIARPSLLARVLAGVADAAYLTPDAMAVASARGGLRARTGGRRSERPDLPGPDRARPHHP